MKNVSINEMMNMMVPVSRFNKGEASKIFEEVKETGIKLAIKNNTPACVLITPDEYSSMVEALEDYALFVEAEKRMKNFDRTEAITQEEVLSKLGITESELDDVDVEIE